jgi:DNA-binding NtrC family response regulator
MKAIMIVDDEFIILESLRLQLSRLIGPDILLEAASSAQEACSEIEAMSQRGDDLRLVISDFNLDDAKGTDVLKVAASFFPDTLKVILSGQSDNTVLEEFNQTYGLYAFVSKPWDFEQIKQLVESAIA